MKIIRESFEETKITIEDELNRQKYTELETEATNAYQEQWLLSYQEKLSDTITLEDELSNLPIANMVRNELGQLLLAGQLVEFKVYGKNTLRPYLGGIELKGNMKRKVIYALIHMNEYETVTRDKKLMFRYTFQYGYRSIYFYAYSVNSLSGYFTVKNTSIPNKSFIRAIEVDRYAYTQEVNEEIEILKEENEMLKDEIERLKSLLQ